MKTITLGETCRVRRGASPRPIADPKWFAPDGRGWVRIQDATRNGKYLRETEQYLSEAGVEKSVSVEPGDVIVSVAATVGVAAIVDMRACIHDGWVSVSDFKNVFDGEYLYYALTHLAPKIAASGQTGAQKNINSEILRAWPIPYPTHSEQARIARLVGGIDGFRESLRTLIGAKSVLKRGLMQQLLTGRKRFPEFVESEARQPGEFGTLPEDWDVVRIGEIAQEVKSRGQVDGAVVYSCTKHEGLVPSLEYFGKQVFSRNLDNYKRLEVGDFAYATNHIEEGSIGLLRPGQAVGLVSPMYTVFRPNKGVNSAFLYSLLKMESYRRVFEARMSASVDRRGSLRWKEFSKIKVGLPTKPEQDRIARTLLLADQEIEQLGRLRELFESYKRGLLSRLLSGEIQVPA